MRLAKDIFSPAEFWIEPQFTACVSRNNQIFALEMVEDYRNAVTWLSDRSEVDAQQIGVWGTSYSGGLVLCVGTFDKRIKAVVAQVPSAMNAESRQAKAPRHGPALEKF